MGDIGYRDSDGYYFLTGRSADTIISGGTNIYPQEIDDVLLAHQSVAEVCCIGVPNDCLLYTSPSPRDKRQSRMPSSA